MVGGSSPPANRDAFWKQQSGETRSVRWRDGWKVARVVMNRVHNSFCERVWLQRLRDLPAQSRWVAQ
eukprot:scaffold105839_cov70-Cyclotella_meneghiniana.AAC.1